MSSPKIISITSGPERNTCNYLILGLSDKGKCYTYNTLNGGTWEPYFAKKKKKKWWKKNV